MTEPLFLAFLDEPKVGDRVTLSGEEGRHASQVRRVRVGETIWISDGAGTAVRGPVVEVGKQKLVVEAGEVVHVPAGPVRYVAVQALPKGDRAQLAVEMLTELGIDEIVPWQSERSVVRWTPDRVERGLTKSDLNTKTAYNTYQIDGLPPGPIANPATPAAVNANSARREAAQPDWPRSAT